MDMKRIRNWCLVMLIALALTRPDVLASLITGVGGSVLILWVLWQIVAVMVKGMLPGRD